jgi:hypothetical protein
VSIASIDAENVAGMKAFFLEKGDDYFRKLAYATKYQRWLKKLSLIESPETWEKYKATHFGRFIGNQ